MNSQALQTLLEAVANGTLKPDAALENLKIMAFEPVTRDGETEFARIDHHRSLRTGFPEVIWGISQSSIASIIIYVGCPSLS